jgi:hypothetical protein
MPIATGTFEVNMAPQAGSPAEGTDAIARFVLDKSYAGDLTATGRGQMLASRTAVDGSAGYVAIEHIEGKLAGHEGGFVIQHFGIMDRGSPTLHVPIIPDSGTGNLAGISGELTIDIEEDGSHSYTLTYELPV